MKRQLTKILFSAAFVVATLASSSSVFAQVKIGGDPTTIDNSAMLQIDAAATGNRAGVLFPRVALSATDVAAPCASHVAGMVVYNTATAGTGLMAVTPGLYYNDGTQWVSMKNNVNAPSLGLLAYSSGVQSIPAGGHHSIIDLVPKQNDFGGGSFNLGAFTVPTGMNGWYNLATGYMVGGSPGTSGGPQMDQYVMLVVNGTEVARSREMNNAPFLTSAQVSINYYLNAGDVVTMQVYQQSYTSRVCLSSNTFLSILKH